MRSPIASTRCTRRPPARSWSPAASRARASSPTRCPGSRHSRMTSRRAATCCTAPISPVRRWHRLRPAARHRACAGRHLRDRARPIARGRAAACHRLQRPLRPRRGRPHRPRARRGQCRRRHLRPAGQRRAADQPRQPRHPRGPGRRDRAHHRRDGSRQQPRPPVDAAGIRAILQDALVGAARTDRITRRSRPSSPRRTHHDHQPQRSSPLAAQPSPRPPCCPAAPALPRTSRCASAMAIPRPIR